MRIGRLGELEFAVMNYVWTRGGPVTIPDIQAHLSRRRRLAYTTTMTVTYRLYRKGLLRRDARRRPHAYSAAISREDYSAGLLLDVLRDVRDREAVLARFIQRISPEDAETLRRLARRHGGRPR